MVYRYWHVIIFLNTLDDFAGVHLNLLSVDFSFYLSFHTIIMVSAFWFIDLE